MVPSSAETKRRAEGGEGGSEVGGGWLWGRQRGMTLRLIDASRHDKERETYESFNP